MIAPIHESVSQSVEEISNPAKRARVEARQREKVGSSLPDDAKRTRTRAQGTPEADNKSQGEDSIESTGNTPTKQRWPAFMRPPSTVELAELSGWIPSLGKLASQPPLKRAAAKSRVLEEKKKKNQKPPWKCIIM